MPFRHTAVLSYCYFMYGVSCTYVYQLHILPAGSLRLAPVIPDTGMKKISFFGLKPTFLRNGTSFILHSEYLQDDKKNSNYYLFINTSDSFVIPIGGERVTWGCLNL